MGPEANLKRVARALLPHSFYRLIRRRKLARLVNGFPARQHVGTYGGHQLRLVFEDPLAEAWYASDWAKMPEVEVLREHGFLHAGARVFDLGAHQAIVALVFAREVGEAGTVIAVEAEPHNARVAETNRQLNGADNLTVLEAAVADHDGTIAFAPGLNGHIDEKTDIGNVRVEAITIDTLRDRYGNPDIVFLDIEGYEGSALAGAQATLASGAAFFVEVHVDLLVRATPPDIVSYFGGRSLYLAESRPIGSEPENFRPYDGTIPEERFFLLAL